MLAIIAAVAVRISFGGLIGAIVTGDWINTIVASVAFPIACITGVFAGIGPSRGASAGPRQD